MKNKFLPAFLAYLRTIMYTIHKKIIFINFYFYKIKLNELVKREQERMINFRSHQNRNVPLSQIKFDRSNNQYHHSNELNKTGVIASLTASSHLNKSQSAFNLATCKKLVGKPFNSNIYFVIKLGIAIHFASKN